MEQHRISKPAVKAVLQPAFKPVFRPIAIAAFSLLGFLSTAAPAFGQTQATVPHTEASKPADNSAMDAETFYKVLLAELSITEGEPRAGFALMLDTARKTKDAGLFERAVAIALQARSGDFALLAARAWLAAIPTSTDAARYLLQISVSLNQPSMPADIAIALEVAKQTLAKNPADEDAVKLAMALMATKQPQAEQLVTQYFAQTFDQKLNQTDAANLPKPELRLTYVRALLTQSRFAEAVAQLQKLSIDAPTYAPVWLVLGTLQYQLSQEANTQNTQNTKNNKSDRAGAAAAAQTSLNTFIKLTEALPAEQRSASPSRAYILLANMAISNKQYQLAYDHLNKAIASSDDADKPDLQYDLAMMAEKLGRIDEMERILRLVIEAKPNDPQAYNALGYALADRRLRLPEAKILIQKAVELAPTDPFIADSLGWVEFRLGNLPEAERILSTALKTKPDAEIAAHLGEVLWTQGRKEEAVALWKTGKSLNPSNDTLVETLKRLGIKL